MRTLKQVNEELTAKNAALAKVFEEAGESVDFEQVKCLGDGLSTKAKAEKVKAMNDELTDLGKERDEVASILKAGDATKVRERELEEWNRKGKVTHPGAGGAKDHAEAKSLGEMFVKSEAYSGRDGRKAAVVADGVSLKTLFETGAGWAPESIRTGRVVMEATRPIRVIDIIPMGQTSQNAVKYMEETTFTNNAAEAAEGATYGEAALALTEQSSPVQKIAVWLPVTDEQLEDVMQAQSYVNNRLPFMLSQRLDSQMLVGNGTSPNLSGILDRVGLQTQALGADDVPTAVYKAMTKVRANAFAEVNAYITHPNDWQPVRTLRTADGIYIWGSPSEAGPERIWGLPVVVTTAITENTGLVGDFANFCELVERRGIEVKVTDSHSDFFINGKQAIRADMRVAFNVYRPAAFCSVTGI